MDSWRVSAANDFSTFVQALPELVPADSVLYIEGIGHPPADVKAFLDTNQIDDDVKIPGGTLWPKPKIYRIPINAENMQGLAELEANHPTPVGSIHVHVYHGDKVLLMSYDAFLDPFLISREIEKSKVVAFCSQLGIKIEEDTMGV